MSTVLIDMVLWYCSCYQTHHRITEYCFIVHTSAGRHEKWCICKRVTFPNAVYIFSSVQYKKPPKTTLHLYYSGEYCKDFNGKQMYRVPYCSVALSYSLHCCLMLPPHLSVCERGTSMCMHHWINSICIPMFGVQEKRCHSFYFFSAQTKPSTHPTKTPNGLLKHELFIWARLPGFLVQAHVLLPNLAPWQQLGSTSVLFVVGYHFSSHAKLHHQSYTTVLMVEDSSDLPCLLGSDLRYSRCRRASSWLALT